MTGSGEAPLTGGRVTAGVVRVGATVRRPPGPHSEFVGALLRALRLAGFEGAPAPRGRDRQGRDIFDFIEGEVPCDLQAHSDATLRSAAALIRRYHDATAALLGPAASALGLEVVCHNDLSPCNAVFREGEPVALIDFDAAAPGSRAYDLGYATWMWLDLGSDAVSAEDQARRLKLFAEAYGFRPLKDLLDAVILRQTILIAEGQPTGQSEMAAWAVACRAWVERHRTHLTRAA